MATRRTSVFLLTLLLALAAAVRGYEDEGRRWEPEEEEEEEKPEFLMQEAKEVIRTDAGTMKVVRGFPSRFVKDPLHIGFITMEPSSFFIPQYLDSSLILFIRRGEARVGHIHKDELVETTLKIGDIYRIASGSAFYLINTAEGQRLHVICSIPTSESIGWHPFQSFFVAGGSDPASVLSGFDPMTLSTAFNVSESELMGMLKQRSGPIIYLSDSHRRSIWSKFVNMEKHEKVASLKGMAFNKQDNDFGEDDEESFWSWRKVLLSFLEWGTRRRDDRRTGQKKGSSDGYNLYDRKPGFRNNYGWSIAVYESDYKPLRHDDISVFLVNLTAGSMMAPHINPKAHEYGVVIGGSGRIQVVYPNGTLAMDAKVAEGDVFWIPRYFPFCQIASRSGAFEFFGFSTSARNNRPQFLAGAGSLLQAMRGPELAVAFGVSEERLNEIIDAQREATILPSATVAPPDETRPGGAVEME